MTDITQEYARGMRADPKDWHRRQCHRHTSQNGLLEPATPLPAVRFVLQLRLLSKVPDCHMSEKL